MVRQLFFNYAWWATDLARARELIEAFAGLVRSQKVDPANCIIWLISESHFYLHRANFPACVASAELGLRFSSTAGLHLWDPLLVSALLEVDLLRGDVASAERRMTALHEQTYQVGQPRLVRAILHHSAACIAALRRDRVKAWTEYQAAFLLLDGTPIPPALAKAKVLWALTAESIGQAVPTLEDALSTCTQVGFEPGEFACRLRLARRLLEAGAIPAGLKELATALALGRWLELLYYPGIDINDWESITRFAVQHSIEVPFAQEALAKQQRPTARREAESCPLTPRELEALRLSSKGKTEDVIGAILSISESAVKQRLAKSREKLQVTNTKQAIAIAAARGWLEQGCFFAEDSLQREFP